MRATFITLAIEDGADPDSRSTGTVRRDALGVGGPHPAAAERLAEAVLAGDHERARALAEELRALEGRPAAPLRRVR